MELSLSVLASAQREEGKTASQSVRQFLPASLILGLVFVFVCCEEKTAQPVCGTVLAFSASLI